jgi:hypothetical protein
MARLAEQVEALQALEESLVRRSYSIANAPVNLRNVFKAKVPRDLLELPGSFPVHTDGNDGGHDKDADHSQYDIERAHGVVEPRTRGDPVGR